ncbi:MAG TPA: DUF2085 domain-containing protein [Anaerolineaceae bacterium]|nr:DUF2085 domain-containing protein [Anaerolineaceae bacterium]
MSEAGPLPKPALPERKRPGRVGYWVVGGALAVLFAAWLALTPSGFWGKLQALGYAVCHQIPERSFHAGEHTFPLCARCTGMYLGAVLAFGFQLRQGKRGKLPPVWILVILGVFLLAFGVDGVNSFLNLIPGWPALYASSNTLRLLTGLGVGVGIGAILYPIFNQSIWQDWLDEAALSRLGQFLVLLALAGLLAFGIVQGYPAVTFPAMVISGLAVPFLLTLIYTIVASLLLRLDNRIRNWRELVLPLMLGGLLALSQIALTDTARYLVTGTWSAIFP